MTKYVRSALLKLVEQHLELTCTSASSLGAVALSDPNFVSELRAGRQPQHSTAHTLLDYMIHELSALTEAAPPPVQPVPFPMHITALGRAVQTAEARA